MDVFERVSLQYRLEIQLAVINYLTLLRSV